MDNHELNKDYLKWCAENEQSPTMREETVFVCGYNAGKKCPEAGYTAGYFAGKQESALGIQRIRAEINELINNAEVLKKVAEIILMEMEK